MNPEDFKNIVGAAKTGETATIHFFGKITEESASQFCNEFDYLDCCIRPERIRVLINSEGGSVLYGMAVYSIIQNANVPTECIIEGMASIIKRFGLKKEHIEAIMNGEAGKDGTFFDAKAAVKAGIIPEENVIRTSKQICDKVQNEISGLESIADMQAALARISAEVENLKPENKHFQNESPTLKQKQHSMNEEKNRLEYAAIAASLGLKDGYEAKDVITRISTLIGVEARLAEATKALSDSQTVQAGKDATILNLQKENGELTTALKTYRDKETEEKKTRINTLIEAAIADGRINKQTQAQWIQMAEANLPLVETTLNSIPIPDKISKEIASDPANVQAAATAAQNASKTAGDKITEQVKTVVGENFQFKKLK